MKGAGGWSVAAELKTVPEQFYARDTGRDSIMTCLKLTVMALLEFVLKEYLGGAAMEWRTYIEQLVPMPVTVRESCDSQPAAGQLPPVVSDGAPRRSRYWMTMTTRPGFSGSPAVPR